MFLIFTIFSEFVLYNALDIEVYDLRPFDLHCYYWSTTMLVDILLIYIICLPVNVYITLACMLIEIFFCR